MALSGSKTVPFCSRKGANRFYLKWDWTATQSITANTSTVTVKLYIGSYGNGYGISSTASKSGSITIDGTSYSFTNTCGISSGGSKLLATKSKTITHTGDGTKTFAINASFNPNVTISGTTQGNVTMGSTSYTLNTIARASSITSNATWKFPDNKTITISKKNSSFTSTVRVYVGGTLIKTWDKTKATSFSTSFSVDNNKAILGKLGSGLSASAEIQLDTYSGSTKIGSTVKVTGTVTAYGRSSTTFPSSFNIGSAISGKITENHSTYTHTLELLDASSNVKFTILNKSGTLSWSYTPTASTLYGLTPNANSYTGKIRLTTYYNGVQVGSANTANITWKVTSSNPTFSPTLAYSDTNSTTSGVTGNNQYIVQNKSYLVITCGVSSTTLKANNSATLKELTCTIAGRTEKATYNSSTTSYSFNFGTVNASSNQSAVIKAVDSRGNSTSKSITVNFLAYTAPKITPSIGRANQFSTTVNVKANGSISPLTISGSHKNGIKAINYTKKIDSGSTSSAVSLTATTSGASYSTNNSTFTLAETSIAKVVVTVTDKLDGKATATIDIATGQPIMFIDADNGSVAFNCLPAYKSTAHFGLKLDLARNQYWGGGKASYGLNAGNSDIVHINSLVFGDYSNNLGEGLRFPNSSYAWDTDFGHQNTSVVENGQTGTALKNVYGDYTNVFFRNQELWVDMGKFMKFENTGYGANLWTNNYIYGFANGYIFQCQDVDPAEANKSKGFILTDTNRSSQFHADPNEMIWTAKNSNGVRVYSPNYLQASTHNIQVHAVGGESGASLGSLKLTSDSNGGYFQSSLIYNRTLSNAANVYINGSGTLYRSTSSARYKLDITPAFDSIEDYKKILDIEPVKWFDKASYEEYAQALTREYNGEEPEELAGGSTPLSRVYGCVAEQLEEVGLNCLVTYEDDGVTTSGVAYDRIPIMYIPLIKDLYNQVDELKAEIQTLKGETGK